MRHLHSTRGPHSDLSAFVQTVDRNLRAGSQLHVSIEEPDHLYRFALRHEVFLLLFGEVSSK